MLLLLTELLQSYAVVEIRLWSCVLKHLCSYKSRGFHFRQNKLIKILLVMKELKDTAPERAELQPRQFLYLRIFFFIVSAPSSFLLDFFFFFLLLLHNLLNNGTDTKPWLEIPP